MSKKCPKIKKSVILSMGRHSVRVGNIDNKKMIGKVKENVFIGSSLSKKLPKGVKKGTLVSIRIRPEANGHCTVFGRVIKSSRKISKKTSKKTSRKTSRKTKN